MWFLEKPDLINFKLKSSGHASPASFPANVLKTLLDIKRVH